MRVAYASPFPPATSGIADYSAALAPRLAEHVELELFHEGRQPPATPAAPAIAGLRPRPVRELAAAAADFDLVLYHLGNSAPHHEESWRLALSHPGVVLLHEYMFHHLVRELTLARGDAAGYVEEMRYAAGETGRRAAERLLDSHYPVDVWAFPLFERLVDRSLAVLVHSEFARRRILASRPRARVSTIPFPVDVEGETPVDPASRRAARRRLGLDETAFLIGSFGFVTPQKHLEPALAAFARLRREVPAARFLIVGEVSPHYDLAALLRATGDDGVVVTGRVDAGRFADHVRAVDLAVNLRHPTGGETSASLFRLLACGVPTVATDAGSFAELPAGAVALVPVDELESERLAALFARFAADPALAAELGRAGRRQVERHHAIGAVAARIASELAAVAADPPRVEPPVPPLAPWSPLDPAVQLIREVGGALADLDLGEEEPELNAALAAELVDLGLDRSR
jgi:glycosyltransferase involved in cell wall biosynthesis